MYVGWFDDMFFFLVSSLTESDIYIILNKFKIQVVVTTVKFGFNCKTTKLLDISEKSGCHITKGFGG